MITLDLLKEEEIPYIQKLYKKSFPKIERKPWSTMMNFTKEGKYLPFVVHDAQKNPVGMCFFMVAPDLALLDYLAIDEKCQSEGYGACVLKLIPKVMDNRKTIIEIEPLEENADNYEQRVRRLKFYLRNGVHTTDLVVKLYDNDYHVCFTGGDSLSYEEYRYLYTHLYTEKRLKDKLYIIRREKIDERLYIGQ